MVHLDKLEDYIRTVIRQAHASEGHLADRFYMQAWLIDNTDVVVIASSPYIRVTRKIYYRLMNNLPKNFGLKLADVSQVVYHADMFNKPPYSGIVCFEDYVILGLAFGRIYLAPFRKTIYLHVAMNRGYETVSYLNKYLPPQLHVEDETQRLANARELDEKCKALGARYSMTSSDFTDPLAASQGFYADVTGFRPPEPHIEPILTMLPENGRKPISI